MKTLTSFNKSITPPMNVITMQPEILSKEIIKPYHPTPLHNQILQSSLLDQLSPHIYVRVIFFYLPTNTHQNPDYTPSNITKLLKKSLSKTLTSYYPFAGRVNQDGHIDCNDEGVKFYEGHGNCQLSDILREPNLECMSKLLPISGNEALSGRTCKDSLVIIQITNFECGGISIGVCFSHKIADASSIATFMNDWASTTRYSNFKPCPEFNGALYFPNHDEMITMSPKMLHADENCCTRRFVFDMAKIDALLRHSNDDELDGLRKLNPTRFEIVTALICRSVVSATTSLGLRKPNLLNVIVNLRTRMRPPLSENHVGNYALHNLVKVRNNGEMGLQGLVCDLKDGKSKFGEEFVKDQELGYQRSLEICKSYRELETLFSDSLGSDQTMLLFSSWCRFPFYEADFGFGKPSWVSLVPNPTKNCVFLCDAKTGDDVEVWVSLAEQVMGNFEHDQELLRFAAVNPCPL